MTMTENTVEVSTDKMNQAYFNWGEHPLVESRGDYVKFWAYVGEYENPRNGIWKLTPEGATRIGYLLGPYASTIIRAWYKVNINEV